MTLLEEAIKFGGDATAIEPELARAYLDAGEYRSLATLKSVAPAERERAQWLAARESRTVASDSILSVALRPPTDSTSVGRVVLRVDGRTLDAAISARVSGIIISDTSSLAHQLRRFAADGERGSVLAAADSIGLGRMSVSNVPVTIARVDGSCAAIIGLDMLGQYVPTFDPLTAQITLHVGTPRAALPNGKRFVTWRTRSDLQLLQAGGWLSITRPSMARVLSERRWTFDAKRGALIVEPERYRPRRRSSTSRQRSCTTSIPARARRSAAASLRMPSCIQTDFGLLGDDVVDVRRRRRVGAAKDVDHVDLAGHRADRAIDRLAEDLGDLGIVDRDRHDLVAGALRVLRDEVRRLSRDRS